MENIYKKPYELSLWKDILTFVTDEKDIDGQNKKYTGENISEANGKIIAQYYEEQRLYTLGSDTMTSPIRAHNPKINFNINGDITLTFSLYNRYFDEEDQQHYINPLIPFLTNERKIKLRYGPLGNCEWYDFVIKNIEEDSETELFSYTAKSLFVNELSKTGFNIELNPELENNMGTITDLAAVILEDSDWRLEQNNAVIKQYVKEPLYKIILSKNCEITDMLEPSKKIQLLKGDTIYSFYSIITNKNPFFQLLYFPKGEKIPVDDNNVIIKSPNYFIEGMTYYNYGSGAPTIASSMDFCDSYQGERLVRKPQTKYDSTIDKFVQVYEHIENGKPEIAYGYTQDEYISPVAVINYVTNSTAYDSTTGWNVGGYFNGTSTEYPELDLSSYPDIRDIAPEEIDNYENFTTYLKYHPKSFNQVLMNSGISDYKSQINGFTKKQKYVFRIKIKLASSISNDRLQGVTPYSGNISFKVSQYELTNGVYKDKKVYFQNTVPNTVDKDGYRYVFTDCLESLNYSEMILEQLGLFISLPNNQTYYIEDVQFFQYLTYEKETSPNIFIEEMCVPGGEITSIVKTRYMYYRPDASYKSIDDVMFFYTDFSPSPNFKEIYYNDFEKIRSITASESNRFNLIQTLCETFECWAKFRVEHDLNNGKILLDENYRQKKWVGFYESITQENFCGFKYGINLKSIQRRLDSDGIISKIIVKNNSNEFAKNGFCTIARAQSSEIKENFILDFSYYIQQQLLNFNEVNNDLYIDKNGYIGYYKKLRQINQNRDKNIEELSNLISEIPSYEASYQTYTISVQNAEAQLRDQEILLERMTGYSLSSLVQNQDNYWWNNKEALAIIHSIGRLKNTIVQHKKLKVSAESNLNKANARKDFLNNELETLVEQKKSLNQIFYKKYSRFIQEGSWISEDYIDDELYYLDAKSTLHTSSQPKVSYTINVLELSQLPDYKNYHFQLGDKTFIEDTKFFGWIVKNGIRTPYKEEIIVTELLISLDSPEENQIKVQNYRGQFEDLFQRITATTQAVEYSTGAYNKVSGIIEEDGTITPSTLQNSIANNSLTLQNSKDQSVTWDETGITTISLVKPSEMLRIVSGGLFLSTDGGVTWTTGVTGSGISANSITSGQLNTSEVNIMNGAFPSFRWDKIGLNAYSFQENNGKATAFDTSKFIRFDQYGLYGMTGHPNFNPNEKIGNKDGLELIKDLADFSLTWKGFKIKSKHENEKDKGYISISSEDDFQVFNGEGKEQIKVGRLPSGSNADFIYGIKINDKNGKAVLQSDNQGILFLTRYLRIGPDAGMKYKDRAKFGIIESYDKDNNIVQTDSIQKEFSKILSIKGTDHIQTEENLQKINGIDEVIALYDDGTLVAKQLIADNLKGKNVDISGRINATSGQIGNFTIGEVETVVKDSKKIEIQSEKGFSFKVNNTGIVTPSELILMAIPIGFDFSGSYNLTWEGSSDYNEWESLNSFYKEKTQSDVSKIILPYTKVQGKQNYYIRLTYKKIILDKTEELKAYSTITILSDGEKGDPGEPGKQGIPGESIITIIIESSKGNIFINGVQDTILTARVFNGNTEITSQYEGTNSFTWVKQNQDGSNDENWNQKNQNNKTNKINIGNNDVDQRAKFTCILNE